MRKAGLFLFLALAGCASSNNATMDGWETLFNGRNMDGWRLMAVHGGRGGIWTVENGALVANQDTDHTGGLIATEERYDDFEIEFEFQGDYPVDTGVFLRTQDNGNGYQITIDYRDNGTVGSVYASGDGGMVATYDDWRSLYREEGWNTMRVRIEGYPAHVTAWLNGTQTVDFHDMEERFGRDGYIGFQVHGGDGSWGDNSRARFRNVRIREI